MSLQFSKGLLTFVNADEHNELQLKINTNVSSNFTKVEYIFLNCGVVIDEKIWRNELIHKYGLEQFDIDMVLSKDYFIRFIKCDLKNDTIHNYRFKIPIAIRLNLY